VSCRYHVSCTNRASTKTTGMAVEVEEATLTAATITMAGAAGLVAGLVVDVAATTTTATTTPGTSTHLAELP